MAEVAYMNSFEFKYYGNDIVTYNKTLFTEFPQEYFNPSYLASNHSLHCRQLKAVDVKGRGGVYVFRCNDQDLVLRHYYRGGMISKFINDLYFWRGLYKTRAIDELQMLSIMQGMNLPTPIPVAAHIHRVGFVYKADIVTQMIPQAKTLSRMLTNQAISIKDWEHIGSVIRKFHNKNCNHIDLNAHNILLDAKSEIFLIDFDKSRIEKITGAWCQDNLDRLQRSLIKLNKLETTFHYSEDNFKSLMNGYGRV